MKQLHPLVAIVLALFAPLTIASEPDLPTLQTPASQLVGVIERFETDRNTLSRSNPVSTSPARTAKFRQFFGDWLRELARLDFDKLSHADQIDYVLFRAELEYELRQLDFRQKQLDEVTPLLPFAQTITDLEESRRQMKPVDPAAAAASLTQINKQIEDVRKAIEAGLKDKKDVEQPPSAASAPPSTSPATSATAPTSQSSQSAASGPQPIRGIKKTAAERASSTVNSLRNTLRNWNGYYNNYDPLYSWWMAEPYKTVEQSLQNYAKFLREKVVGVKPDDDNAIIGDPIGRDGLQSDLDHEFIPYSPDELIAIAEKEFAWCQSEFRKAAAEMGCGDDYLKAIEIVKTKFVEPGQQPAMIRELAFEAIEYLEKNELVTIPPLARDCWRMEMMSPERQLQTPFFTGGEVISVSYPTSTMTHEQKLMSMRGNNRHFSRATVHHELIPGHHLQGYMNSRYMTHRRTFGTPFWLEGWAVYWETLLWDRGFPKSAEDKIGMLFWRMHRCARIIFSLKFHLEQMTPEECIEFLVTKVGHERDNATAEVRRSFGGQYSPLYQCGYMVGALQFRALHRELVDSGKMKDRQMHDAVLQNHSMPVELVRAALTKQKLTRDHKGSWRFAD